MTKLRLINEVLAELRQEHYNPKDDQEWRKALPPGSRWQPGYPGNPACKICEGTGFLRLDLPVGHRYFGQVFLCECTEGKPRP